jgi:hypothetical protein
MNVSENTNIIIREGTHSDNEGLVQLTSLTPMKGEISIRIDRNPLFFRLLELRGPSFVIVAEIQKKIIGSYSISKAKVYIDGKSETIYYLGDFKVHPDFQKSTVAIRLIKAAYQKLISINADLLFCTVALGNDPVAPFFKGRAFIPPAKNIGTFTIFQIIPSPFISKSRKYCIEEKRFSLPFISFFDNFMKHYQFCPVYTENSFENCTLITASINNELVAAMALADVEDAKQSVLINLSFKFKCIAMLMRGITKLFPVIRMPQINKTARILYIKSFSYKPGYEYALKPMIEKARYLAYRNKYVYINIGIHEKDPAQKTFSKYPHFKFKTIGYVFSLKGSENKINSIIEGVPFEDYSLV